MRSLIIFLTFLWIPIIGFSQIRFSITPTPPVNPPGISTTNAWAGGLNSPQFNTMDINGDGEEDLVIFDRTNANVQTFLKFSTYAYRPSFERFFPDDLEGWMLLRDYDCDGRKDIFTRSPFGIRVFRNVTPSNGDLEFELFKNIVFTEGTNGLINLQVNISDIPVIEDIDLDGDLDILTFDPGTGGRVQYHQNQTLENFGSCDSLAFVRVEERWGDFEECFCQDFAFGETCEEKDGGRLLHASGKAILAMDFDRDGDKDFIYGDESCNEIQYLENIGDSDNALIRGFTIEFPNTADPVAFPIFPATYYEDVTFDGKKDLIFAPNVFSNATGDVDFSQSSWLYENVGTEENPDFQLQTKRFLQEEMIDLGDRAAPAFADWDGDGDLDMIIGHDVVENGSTVSQLAYYENIQERNGNVTSFEFTENNLLDFKSLDLLGIHPYIVDLDQDGSLDLVLTGTTNPPIRSILFFKNNALAGDPFDINPGSGLTLDITLTTSDRIAFFDEDRDDRIDLFVGTSQGNLIHYRRTSVDPIQFELERNDYAGLAPDPERPSLVPHFADLDNNGEEELITLDRTGRVRIFADVRLFPNPEPIENILLGSPEPQYTTFGGRTMITSADLITANSPDLIFGTAQGGLNFLANRSNQGQEVQPRIVLELFPNPVDPLSSSSTIISNRRTTLQIISIMGQVIQGDLEVPGNTPTTLDFSTVPAGIYLIRAESPGFKSTTEKIIVSQ